VTDAEESGLLASFSLDTAQEDESADLTDSVRALLAGGDDFLGVNLRETSIGNFELIVVGIPQLHVNYFVPAEIPLMSHWHLLLLASCLVFASSVALSYRP
jgi:hypothetical protein